MGTNKDHDSESSSVSNHVEKNMDFEPKTARANTVTTSNLHSRPPQETVKKKTEGFQFQWKKLQGHCSGHQVNRHTHVQR